MDEDYGDEDHPGRGDGSGREPEGPAAEGPQRRERVREVTEFAQRVRLRDDDRRALRRIRHGAG